MANSANILTETHLPMLLRAMNENAWLPYFEDRKDKKLDMSWAIEANNISYADLVKAEQELTALTPTEFRLMLGFFRYENQPSEEYQKELSLVDAKIETANRILNDFNNF